MRFLSTLVLLFFRWQLAKAFDYVLIEEPEDASLSLTDVETEILDIATIFTGEFNSVVVTGIEWMQLKVGEEASDDLQWTTFVDGKEQDSGTFNLTDVGRELPTELEVGQFKVDNRGRHEVLVELTHGSAKITVSAEYESYAAGVAIIPLLVVLVMAATTQMVELSLFSAIFVGACMVTGSVKYGFFQVLDNYILNAVADVDHGYVYLFTLFLSGLVGMMEKSGGMGGFTKDVQSFAKSPRTGQFACFGIGIFVFFDDYANVLLAGETMRPLLDMLSVSREKLAFIVDATAAPIASISPISSWVGFEVLLIQTEIDRIIDQVGEENLYIKNSGLAVFLQSIKYRYYPIFMIVLMIALLWSQRDYGAMLIAERKTEIYQRKDGGDGQGLASTSGDEKHNQPGDEVPKRSWNMIAPVLILVFLIFWLLVQSGDSGEAGQALMNKIENSDSFTALLFGTMGAVILTLIFYLLQFHKDGEICMMSGDFFKELFSRGGGDNGETKPRSILGVGGSVEAFLFGMGRIFPALVVLTLAWASGSIMIAVGADRLFSRVITSGIAAEALPTLSFVIAFFMALATGTSWGTMSIMFPLLLPASYQALAPLSNSATKFYAVVAGILSGSVAGDHVSPISDTTVLSALSCDCKLLSHVVTQSPYVIFVVLVSMILGTIPIGYSEWPNIIGILLGAIVVILFVYFVCVRVLDPQGRYDFITECFLKLNKHRGQDSELFQLRSDTIAYVQGGLPSRTSDIKIDDHMDGKKSFGGALENDTVEDFGKETSSAIYIDSANTVEA